MNLAAPPPSQASAAAGFTLIEEGVHAIDVHFSYSSNVVLDGANLSLKSGDVLALLGANGAGKSTLLKIMLGLSKPDQGEIFLHGRAFNSYGRRQLAQHLAYVPQVHSTPFPYKVREIVLLGRIPATGFMRSPTPEDHAIVHKVLQRMGIEHLADRPYTEVSGGERQLTLLARAMAQGARMLVMDEPMNGLDYGHQIRLLERLRELAKEGYGILMTTHHPEHALLAATRVALLLKGRIAVEGLPSAVVTPETIRSLYGVDVASFHSGFGHTAFYPDF